MTFTPRNFTVILNDMLAYMQLVSDLTDFEVGSVIRTILEACALEDDEQYFQMVQLLDAFRLSTASGRELDGRVAEFNIIRLQPAAASGEIVIRNENLIKSSLEFDEAAGSTTIILEDSSDFPSTGTIRIGEGTVTVEDIAFTANNTGTNTLTISGATFKDHSAGDRVALVDGTANIPLTPGIRAQVPSEGTTPAIVFVSTESGTLVNGNYESTPIRVSAEIPGSGGNLGTGQITEFASASPFNGAAVTNLTRTGGGRDLESDADLRSRARSAIQAIGGGTVLALKEGTVGVTDDVTKQTVTTSNVLESFVNSEVIVYIDDGTGFTPDSVTLARSSLSGSTLAGASVLTLVDASEFPSEGFIVVSPENAVQTEILEYSSVNYSTNALTLVGTAANAHDAADEVALVDILTEAAEPGQSFFQLSNIPAVRSSYRVWVDSGGAGNPLLQEDEIDYFLNKATGQLEFAGSGVAEDSIVAVTYAYYTGLIATVQKVITGDEEDPLTYPGISAAGIIALAETPLIRRITVHLSISTIPGVQESDISTEVQEAIESYINGLGIGEDVIISEIIEQAMSVTGMYDARVLLPTSNVVILENELPVPFASNGTSLVTVS